MPTINAIQPIRLEGLGLVKLVDGATTYTIQAYEPGTLEIEPGFYESLHYNDRGIPQPPLEGTQALSKIRYTVKLTTFVAAELYALLITRGATGLKKEYSVVIDWLDNKGVATGERLTFAGCSVPATGVKIRTGAQFDLLEAEFESRDAVPTASTF